jgi:hypothetical protein
VGPMLFAGSRCLQAPPMLELALAIGAGMVSGALTSVDISTSRRPGHGSVDVLVEHEFSSEEEFEGVPKTLVQLAPFCFAWPMARTCSRRRHR